MTKTERIEALEKQVADLLVLVATLQARPFTYSPYIRRYSYQGNISPAPYQYSYTTNLCKTA